MTTARATSTTALVLIDIQQGFADLDFWGPTTNPDAEARAVAIATHWRSASVGPVIVVQHHSTNPASPLHPSNPGHALVPSIASIDADLTITKNVNSAFYGDTDLHAWLTERGIRAIALAGIQTNMCVETTARMGGNLGYAVEVILDATRTFDLATTLPDGTRVERSADELVRTAAVNLAAGGFARITASADYLAV